MKESSLRVSAIDPVLDPIRNDSGFQLLLVGTEQIGPNKQGAKTQQL